MRLKNLILDRRKEKERGRETGKETEIEGEIGFQDRRTDRYIEHLAKAFNRAFFFLHLASN